jgi:serine O-acetyltransferase
VNGIATVEPIITKHSFKELIFSDVRRVRPRKKPSWVGVLIAIPAHPGILACLFLRGQQILIRRGYIKLAYWTRTLCGMLTGADIAPGAHVGLGLYLVHPVGVCIGYGANLGDNITMASGVVIGVRNYGGQQNPVVDEGAAHQPVATVGDNVFFGAHAVLVGDVKIGNNAVIGANSVVGSDVPDNAVMLGVPARIVATRG